MHQFLNQLLAKKKILHNGTQVCLPASSLQSWGLAQSAGGRERVPHFLLSGTTGSTGSTEVSLEGH